MTTDAQLEKANAAMARTGCTMITTVARITSYAEGEDEEGQYCDNSTTVIETVTHSTGWGNLYAYVRQISEYAADMGDGSSAELIVAYFTDTREPFSVEMLIEEAFREEVEQ